MFSESRSRVGLMWRYGDPFRTLQSVPINPAWRRPRTCRLVAAVLLAIAAGSSLPASADVIGQAQVVDGDTLQVAGERVRLHGIDAPESRQSCTLSGSAGPAARTPRAC